MELRKKWAVAESKRLEELRRLQRQKELELLNRRGVGKGRPDSPFESYSLSGQRISVRFAKDFATLVPVCRHHLDADPAAQERLSPLQKRKPGRNVSAAKKSIADVMLLQTLKAAPKISSGLMFSPMKSLYDSFVPHAGVTLVEQGKEALGGRKTVGEEEGGISKRAFASFMAGTAVPESLRLPDFFAKQRQNQRETGMMICSIGEARVAEGLQPWAHGVQLHAHHIDNAASGPERDYQRGPVATLGFSERDGAELFSGLSLAGATHVHSASVPQGGAAISATTSRKDTCGPGRKERGGPVQHGNGG